MRIERPRHREHSAPALASGIVLISAALLFGTRATPTITARFGGVDGGELAAVALSGGVAHPSGYPSYLLLARLALLLPGREAAGQLALLSALCAALAIAASSWLVGGATMRRDDGSGGAALVAGLCAGGLLLSSARIWSQAVIAEVYALHLLWLVLCVLLGLCWLRTGEAAALAGALLSLGLGLGTHLTLAIVAPALGLAALLTPRRPKLSQRTLLIGGGALLAGLALYGWLPLWARRGATPSWGDPATPGGLWAHISGAEYRYLLDAVPWRERLGRVGYAARDLLHQPGPLGLALAAIFLSAVERQERALLACTATIALGSLLFAVGYGGADGTVYLLPWTWAWSVWGGLGGGRLWRWLAERYPHRQPVGGALLAAALLWPIGAQARQHDLHTDTSERDRAIARLTALPPAALLLTADDRDTFGGWYVQRALGLRPDVHVLDTRLLSRPWYQAQLQRTLRLDPALPICPALAALDRPTLALDATDHPQPATWNCVTSSR